MGDTEKGEFLKKIKKKNKMRVKTEQLVVKSRTPHLHKNKNAW